MTAILSSQLDNALWWTPAAASRLKSAIANWGSQQAAAEKAGLSRSGLGLILAGQSIPKLENLTRVVQAIGADLGEILGEEMTVPDTVKSVTAGAPGVKAGPSLTLNYYRDIAAAAGRGGTGPDHDGERLAVSLPVPLSGRLAGRTSGLDVITVYGDSMMPTFCNGDWVIVDREDRRRREGVYCLRIAGELMVKRVQWQPTRAIVISDNQRYRPFEVDLDQMDDEEAWAIIGRVVFAGVWM